MKTKRALGYDEFRDRADIATRLISAQSNTRWVIWTIDATNKGRDRNVEFENIRAEFRRMDGVPSGTFELTGADLSRSSWRSHVILKFNKWSTELLEDEDAPVDEETQDERAPITFEQAAEAVRGAVDATKESQRKRHHNESVALVTEMVAGAGFEKVYHQGDQFIIWQQILPARTNVKVTLALTFDDLQKPPAEIFRLVFDQVGAK